MKLLVSIALGAALLVSGLSRAYAALPAEAEEFNKFFGIIEHQEGPKGPKTSETVRQAREPERRQTRQLPKLWDIMDRLVVGLLDKEQTTRDIQGILSQLSGYKAPRSAQKTIIGNAEFSDGVDRDYPNYRVTPVERSGTVYVIGVYNDDLYSYGSLTSRLSVYMRGKAGWVKTAGFEGTTTMCLYVLSPHNQIKALMTVEQFVGGDHIDGSFKFWELKPGGKLRLVARNDKLLDYGIYLEESKLTIAYTKFPRHLPEPFLGDRVRFTLDVSVDDRGLQRKVTCLNPWLEVLDDYFSCLDRRDLSGAKAYLAAPLLQSRLKKFSWITRDEGDINLGTGVIETNEIRFEFRRNKSGKWVISEVLQK